MKLTDMYGVSWLIKPKVESVPSWQNEPEAAEAQMAIKMAIAEQRAYRHALDTGEIKRSPINSTAADQVE